MPAGESQDKFECRYCGCKQSKVTHTEIIERQFRGRQLTLIKRRRQCRRCAMGFTTVEHQYTDIITHKIPGDSAMRPAYDYGRAVGALEFINAINKPTEEQEAPPMPLPPDPPRGRRAIPPQKRRRKSR